MRIAIFTDTYAPHVNGVARTLARLGLALGERGHGVRVFTVADPRAEQSSDIVRWPGLPFWGYPELRLAAPTEASVTARLRAWAPHLVHVATPFGVGLAGVSAAARLDVPVVSSYHTSFSAYARSYGLGALATPGWHYLRWFHNRTRRTYVPTRAIASELESHQFTNVRLWPRGIDADVFHPRWRSAELRRSWGATDDTVVVAYIGRVAKEKGVDVAVDAVANLHARLGDRRREMIFAVVGDGPHESAVRARAPEGTRFLGRLTGTKLSAAYASADVLLFPSTTDTFGNVLLEGMASRLVVVAADLPQAREVCPGSAAAFFRRDNSAALADELLRLLEDPARRERMRESGWRHAQTCGWDAVFDALFADYQSVIHDAQKVHELPSARGFDVPRGFSIGGQDDVIDTAI
jgi:glycosyltransferase involved in cell wall biosynthesis